MCGSTKDKAVKILYSSSHSSFASKQCFGRLTLYRTNKYNIERIHMSWDKFILPWWSHHSGCRGLLMKAKFWGWPNGLETPVCYEFPHPLKREICRCVEKLEWFMGFVAWRQISPHNDLQSIFLHPHGLSDSKAPANIVSQKGFAMDLRFNLPSATLVHAK